LAVKNDLARNKAIERLVAEKLRQKALAAGPGCASPEILAAYVDGALSPAERERWETHFASCAPCQEHIAGLVRLGPGEPQEEIPRAAAAPAWRLRWAWAATGLVAVVAAGLWYTGEFTQHSRRASEIQPELTAPSGNATAPPAPEIKPPLMQPAEKPQVARPIEKRVHGAPVPAPASEKAEPGAAGSRARELREPKQAIHVEEAAPAAPMADLAAPRKTRAGRPGTAPAGIATPSERAQLSLREKTEVLDRATAAKAPEPGSSIPSAESQPAPSAPESSAFREKALPARDELQAKKEAGAGPSAAKTALHPTLAGGLVSSRLTGEKEVPGWRVGRHGLIERTDGKGKWETMPSGVDADLYDISFSSPQVGWAVGQAGTILRTTDGGITWSLQSTPTHDDLIRVSASGTLTARVTTREGKSYSTTDGGKSWQASPQP